MKEYKHIRAPVTDGYSDIETLMDKVNAMAVLGWRLITILPDTRTWPNMAIMEKDVMDRTGDRVQR